MRVDKYIWCIRLAKTRSIASKRCAADQVKVNDEVCKPAKTVSKGDVIALRETPIWKTYQVLDIPKSRVGAKLVPDYRVETTSEEDLKLWQEVQETNRQNRQLGFRGRPTKKERRNLDRFKR
ncbi:MAG: S4 domain-containing protein [Vicingaceae bacterium]